MPDYQTRSITAKELRAEEAAGQKIIECYFARFDDTYKIDDIEEERIDPHAFDETIHDDIRALINHDTSLVLGRTSASTLTLTIDNVGLHGRIVINENDQDAMNLYARVQRGDVNQCSFGFDILEQDFEDLGGKYRWTLKRVRLYEVSVVTFPAYEKTEAVARSKERSSMIFDRWKTEMKERLNKHHA